MFVVYYGDEEIHADLSFMTCDERNEPMEIPQRARIGYCLKFHEKNILLEISGPSF